MAELSGALQTAGAAGKEGGGGNETKERDKKKTKTKPKTTRMKADELSLPSVPRRTR